MTKFTFGKYGINEQPIRSQVTWTVKDRTYIGDVVDCYRTPVTNCLILKVNHFNGEPAPDVAASFVEVLRFGDKPQRLIEPTDCWKCHKTFTNGDTCGYGGCPMGGDF